MLIVTSNLFRGDEDDLMIPWISLVGDDDNHDDDDGGGGDDSDDHLVAWLAQCVNIRWCSPILTLVYFSSNTHFLQS